MVVFVLFFVEIHPVFIFGRTPRPAEDGEGTTRGQRLSLASIVNGSVALNAVPASGSSFLDFLKSVVQRRRRHVEERWCCCEEEIFIPLEREKSQQWDSCATLRYLRRAEKEKQSWWVQIYWVITHSRESDGHIEPERESWLVSAVAACNDWVALLVEVEVRPADINLKPIPPSGLRLSAAAIFNPVDEHLHWPNKRVDASSPHWLKSANQVAATWRKCRKFSFHLKEPGWGGCWEQDFLDRRGRHSLGALAAF